MSHLTTVELSNTITVFPRDAGYSLDDMVEMIADRRGNYTFEQVSEAVHRCCTIPDLQQYVQDWWNAEQSKDEYPESSARNQNKALLEFASIADLSFNID